MTTTTATAAITAARVPAKRLPDWQPRLAALVSQRMRQPLVWGRHDCCLWAADAVLAVTGVDLAAGLRGSYDTPAGADQQLHQLGGLVEICVQRLGPVVRTQLAQAGDVGLATVGDVRALVVCGGAHFLAAGAAGLLPVPRQAVLRAWRCTAAADGGAHG
jgi:hypothetical protein